MTDIEKILKQLARKTMLDISEQEMPRLLEEYNIFMMHVKALELINTQDTEPLAFPYEIKTHFLREDKVVHMLSQEDVLKNVGCVQDGQIKVPKVVR